jgi:hypothetical protein
MTDSEFLRRWSATITYADNPLALDSYARGQFSETVQADLSESDLQKEQAKAAFAEAAKFLLAGVAECAFVQLYKTTKKHGTVKSHITYVIDRNDAAAWAMKRIVHTQ